MPILAFQDPETHVEIAHVVPAQGENDYAAVRVALDITKRGHS